MRRPVNDVTDLVILLTIDTRGLRRIGTVRILRSPSTRVVDRIGHHITEVVCQVVGTTEDIVEGHILFLRHMIDRRLRLALDDLLRSRGLQLLVVSRQQHGALRIGLVAKLTLSHRDIGVGDEVTLIDLAQLHPIPIGDGVVQMIGHVVVDKDTVGLCILISILQRRTILLVRLGRIVIGVEVHLHILEFHLTERSGIDVKRYLLGLAVGVGNTRIGRDILVVDIAGTTDEPVVGRCRITTLIGIARGIAIVDDLLHVMHEVT